MRVVQKLFTKFFGKEEAPRNMPDDFIDQEDLAAIELVINETDEDFHDELINDFVSRISANYGVSRQSAAKGLSLSKSLAVRRALASYRQLDEYTVNRLACDEDLSVARRIARRTSQLGDETLQRLVERGDEVTLRELRARYPNRLDGFVYHSDGGREQGGYSTGFDLQRLRSLHAQGFPVSKIARNMDCSETTVYKYLKKLGLKPR